MEHFMDVDIEFTKPTGLRAHCDMPHPWLDIDTNAKVPRSRVSPTEFPVTAPQFDRALSRQVSTPVVNRQALRAERLAVA